MSSRKKGSLGSLFYFPTFTRFVMLMTLLETLPKQGIKQELMQQFDPV